MKESNAPNRRHPDIVLHTHPDLDHVMPRNLNRVLEITINMASTSKASPGIAKKLAALSGDERELMREPIRPTAPGQAAALDPPHFGELVLWFVYSRDHREAMLGDLAEDFQKCLGRHGNYAARTWYWWQVARSLAAALTGLLVKTAGVKELWNRLGM